jgi:ABC-type lipoprotein release transport system permease subunit
LGVYADESTAKAFGSDSFMIAQVLMTGLCVSVAVDLFFGVWPAMKASKLDPVDALRYE